MRMNRKKLIRTVAATLAGAGSLVLSGAMAASASAAPVPTRTVTVANRLRLTLVPPSPCRPSESGGEQCIGVGRVAQVGLLPPSPCAGGVSCP